MATTDSCYVHGLVESDAVTEDPEFNEFVIH